MAANPIYMSGSRSEASPRDTPYQKNSTQASFDMEPPIPMKTRDKIQLWAWDFDSDGFFGLT